MTFPDDVRLAVEGNALVEKINKQCFIGGKLIMKGKKKEEEII